MTIGLVRTGNGTSTGTGTTKTLISPTSGLFMPADARVLLGIKPTHAIGTPTAGQTVDTQFDVESGDIRGLMPFQVIAAPIGAGVGSSFGLFTGKDELWRINAPLTGGEGINVYATSLAANTVAALAQAFMIVSNNPADKGNMPQMHSKIGTLTSTGTTVNTDVAGTKYSFSGGSAVVELWGTLHPKTNVLADYFVGEIKYVSSEFVDAMPQTLPLMPVSPGLQTPSSGSSASWMLPGVARQDVYVPVKPGQVNIQDSLNFNGQIGSAGSFIDGVIYI